MRVVVQRVTKAKVESEGIVLGEIERGLVVFAAIGKTDSVQDIKYAAEKILNLRIFEDQEGKMSLSPLDQKAEILAVSNFTLYGDVRRGRRPDFTAAAGPEGAEKLYSSFVEILKSHGLKVESGKFKADMNVAVANDGPVTILIDSKKGF